MDHSAHGAGAPSPSGGPGYETRDANTLGILIFSIFMVLFVVVTLVSMRWLYGRVDVYNHKYTDIKNTRPETRKITVYEDLDNVRKTAAETLDHYGWVDRKAGVVRVPIERAIDLALERGVPNGKGPKNEADVIRRDQPAQTEADLKKLEQNSKK